MIQNLAGTFRVETCVCDKGMSLIVIYPNLSDTNVLIRHPKEEIPLIIEALDYALSEIKMKEYLEKRKMRVLKNELKREEEKRRMKKSNKCYGHEHIRFKQGGKEWKEWEK